ncbi:hypothetical protein [Halococcus sp. AFM35]|uniref:hypothetical protein n=1 Tax=Halococcus sp. AFM35 TaxID=3421653 RepID=UPI003EC148B1
MSIHMIRATTARSPTLRQWVTTWLTNMQAWAEADNQPPTDRETDDGVPYMAADWRFAWGSNSKATLLGNLIGYARPYADWGVVGWHECYHDTPPTGNPEDRNCTFEYGLPDGFGASIQSGVWGDPPASIDPRSDSA